MINARSTEKKICVWRKENQRFSVSLENLIGIYASKAFLSAGEEGFKTAEIGHANLDFSKIKFVANLTKPTEQTCVSTKRLVLQSADFVLTTNVDELLFYGDENNFKNIGELEILAVSETQIKELGSKKEFFAEAKEKSTEAKALLFFTMADNKYAMEVSDVDEVMTSKQVREYKLVSSQAIGYIYSKGETIPVLSLGEVNLKSAKILVTRFNSLRFGFPVDSITNLVRDFASGETNVVDSGISYGGEPRVLFDLHGALKNINLKEICDGYENVFSLKQSSSKSRNSVLKSLVLIDIGERVCVSMDLIRRIEAVPSDFDPKLETFFYNQRNLPLIDAGRHYGLVRNKERKTSERILILEKENISVAVLVKSVESIIYIDQQTVSNYGQWIFRESSPTLKEDVAGMTYALDFQHKDKMNLMNISFTTIFKKYKTVA